MTLYEIFYSYIKSLEVFEEKFKNLLLDISYKKKILNLVAQLESSDEKIRRKGWRVYDNLSAVELKNFHHDFCRLYRFEEKILMSEDSYPILNLELDRNDLNGFFSNQTLQETDLLERLFLADNENNAPIDVFSLPVRITQNGNVYLNIHQPKTFYANLCFPPKTYQIPSLRDYNFSLTLPDLHGYLVKMLYSLVASGVLGCSGAQFSNLRQCLRAIDGISDNFFTINDLADLQCIYGQSGAEEHNLFGLVSTLTNNICEKLFQIKELVEEIKIVTEGKVLIRFLGDMLADRQGCCVDILLMLSYLNQFMSFEIIFSNHDFEFYRYMKLSIEEKNRFIKGLLHNPIMKASYEGLIRYHLFFYLNPEMQDIVEEVKQTYNDIYLKNIKLLSYEIKDNGEIVIFSHAPCTLLSIIAAAGELEVDDQLIESASLMLMEKSIYRRAEILAKLIDAMNLQFCNKLIGSDLTAFLSKTQFVSELYCARSLNVGLFDIEVFLSGVSSVHGHLGERDVLLNFSVNANEKKCADFRKRMINLDTEIGKFPSDIEGNISLYIGQEAGVAQKPIMRMDDILKLSRPFSMYAK